MPYPARHHAEGQEEAASQWGQSVQLDSLRTARACASCAPASSAAAPEPGALLADLEQLLRTHLSRLAGCLEGRLSKQETLLLRLLEAHCQQALPLLPASPREGEDVVMGEVHPARKLVAEGVHSAPAEDPLLDAADFQLGGGGPALSKVLEVGSEMEKDGPEINGAEQDGARPEKLRESKASQELRKGRDKSGSSGIALAAAPPDDDVAPAPLDGDGGGAGMVPTTSQRSTVMAVAPPRKALSFTSNEEQLKLDFMAASQAQQDLLVKTMTRGVEMEHQFQKRLQNMVESSAFEGFLCFMIISNTIFFGAQVEVASTSEGGDMPYAFQVLDHVFTAVFTTELLIRVMAGCKEFCKHFFTSWNGLDTFVVVSSFVEIALDSLSVGGQGLSGLRVLRMARVMRIVRILRLMRFVRSLRILIHSVMNTVKSLLWTLIMLGMILYLFAILFCQGVTAFRHEHRHDPETVMVDDEVSIQLIVHLLDYYFGSVGIAMFTLFKCITGGVSWQEVAEPLRHVHAIWVALFVSFICFTYLAVLNVVTGVFCQTAIESANYDQDMVVQEQITSKSAYTQQLNKIFRDIDDDHTGTITLEQFERRLKDPTLQAYFDAVGITIDEAWNLFKLLDQDESHVIDMDEFVTGCLRLRGAARTMDIAMLLYQSKWTMQRLTQMTRHMNEQYQSVCKRLDGKYGCGSVELRPDRGSASRLNSASRLDCAGRLDSGNLDCSRAFSPGPDLNSQFSFYREVSPGLEKERPDAQKIGQDPGFRYVNENGNFQISGL